MAEFIIQDETAEKIQEALEILLKQWNPQWKPKYFMTDYSEAKLLAIEKCTVSKQETTAAICSLYKVLCIHSGRACLINKSLVYIQIYLDVVTGSI